MRERKTNTDPLREVVEALLRCGALSIFKPELKNYWWELKLSCGHEVERPVKYQKGASQGRQGWARFHHPPGIDLALPAPKRVRCDDCTREMVRRTLAVADPEAR